MQGTWECIFKNEASNDWHANCTNAFECFLRTVPPPARRELLDWIDAGNEDAVDAFFANAMAKSLLLDWGMQEGMHNTGLHTPYQMMKHYQKYETASLSPRLTQDVLLMAGAEDHYIPVHQLPDQIATLTQVRSLTARLFTHAEQAQNHVQVGNFGLAFRVILDWMASLRTIEEPPLLATRTFRDDSVFWIASMTKAITVRRAKACPAR